MATGQKSGGSKGSPAPYMSAMREAAQRAKNAWGAIRGAEPSPAPEPEDTPREEALEGLGSQAATEEEVVSVREQVLQGYRERLVQLHKKFGRAPDVDALTLVQHADQAAGRFLDVKCTGSRDYDLITTPAR